MKDLFTFEFFIAILIIELVICVGLLALYLTLR